MSHKDKFLYLSFPKIASTSLHSVFDKFDNCEVVWNVHSMRKNNIGVDFNEYFSFIFVRNPWARLVSCWKDKCFCDDRYLKNAKFFMQYKNISFVDFVKVVKLEIDNNKWSDQHIKPITNIIDGYKTILGLDAIDFAGRVENFQTDFDIICNRLGIFREKLYKKNKSEHKHYTEYYDDESRALVSEIYSKDINYFGYEFEK